MLRIRSRLKFVSLRPTLFGVRSAAFYVVVVGAYLSAPYVNLFFLLLAFLTVQWLMAAIWTLTNMAGVSAEFRGIPMIEAGGDADLPLTIHGSRRTRFDVSVSLTLTAPAGVERTASGRLSVLRADAQVRVGLPDLPRGVHRVTAAFASSTYPFGLIRRSVPIAAPKEVVVYPRAAGMTDAGRTAEDWMRDVMGTNSQKGGDLQPTSLRDRRDGDSLRSVHWRASARRGKLVVQEWEGGSGEGLEIAFDRRAERDEFEQALGEIAALVVIAKDGKEALCIRTQDQVCTFGEGHGTWDAALRLLAELEPLPADAPGVPSVSPMTPILPRRPVHA